VVEAEDELLIQAHDEAKGLLIIEVPVTDETQFVVGKDDVAVTNGPEDISIEAQEVFGNIGDGAGTSQSYSIPSHSQSHQLVVAGHQTLAKARPWTATCGFEGAKILKFISVGFLQVREIKHYSKILVFDRSKEFPGQGIGWF